jgi:hypothetical protein
LHFSFHSIVSGAMGGALSLGTVAKLAYIRELTYDDLDEAAIILSQNFRGERFRFGKQL